MACINKNLDRHSDGIVVVVNGANIGFKCREGLLIRGRECKVQNIPTHLWLIEHKDNQQYLGIIDHLW